MGKKDQAKMAQQREKFIAGCEANAITKEKGEELFDAIDRFAQYGFNKCLAGSTTVQEAHTGERTTIENLFRHPRPFAVHGLGEDGRLRARPVTDALWNGRKPVYDLVTRQGRRIRATATHRFRVPGGWQRLGDLRVGDWVTAAPVVDLPQTERLAVSGSESGPAADTSLRHAGPDVEWDRVSAIEAAGVEDTYDLTVDVDHNFVAEGLVVHNSHSAAYAMMIYQTAYFKANYPAEYMTSLLIHMAGNADKVAAAIVDCKKRDLEVLPPDINESGSDFTITPSGQIRFGLNAIKNVGRHAVEHIVGEREENGLYKSLDDLCERVTTEADVNSRALESLIRSGACDGLGERNQLLAVVDWARQRAERLRRDRESGQISIFGTTGVTEDRSSDYGVTATPMSGDERLRAEKELLGLYLSDHPLNRIQGELAGLTDAQAIDITTELTGTEVRVGGLVRELRRVVTRKGQIMAYAEVEDLTGVIDVTLFPRAYDQYRQLFEPDGIVVLQGTVDPARGGGPRNQPAEDLEEPEAEEVERATLLADFAWAWGDPECVPVERQRQMHVDVPESDPEIVDQLVGVIASHPGEDELLLHFEVSGRQVTVRAGDRFRVTAAPALKDALDALFERQVSRLEMVRPRSRGGNGNGNGSNGSNVSNGRGGGGENGRNGRRGG
jgi:uncharacterized membrane protein YgcG